MTELLASEQFSYGLYRIVISTLFGEIATSNCFFSLASKRLVRVAVRYPNFLEKKCGFWTVSQSSVPAVLGKEVRVLNCITRKKEIHSQGEKHSQGVSFLVFQLQLRFNKRVRMPNPQLQKDILIPHLLITTTDSDQNCETHNLARTY